ncbi:unnamed protein product [Candidula unifasciata]|uniref:Hexosyltransferase n=1 Tax=Candidula unifasciata TaxID=100452 RepID=A0A8S3ZI39_9EUPU|nr:unnamed protein product [Candidula unifasciata]
MCCSNLFKVTGRKLIILSLFVFLSVALYARSTYFFSIHTLSSNSSAQTIATPGDIFSHKLQHIPHNRSLFAAQLVSDHPFLMEKIIHSDNFEYIIRPRVTCSGQEIELAICVVISHDNHAGRSVIRRTWGSYANDPKNKAVLVFFVGSEDKESATERRWVRRSRLQEEASIFGDILQENYIDSYRNLSLKSVSILRWVKTVCPKTKYILKVDDDMYVNIPFLMTTMQEFVTESSPPSAFIIGSMQVNALPKRDPSSKWYTSYSVFQEERYPDYVSGPSYVMTSAAAVLLYEATLRVARFWLEDVYITGLCARKAKVRVYDSKYFSYGKPLASGCTFRTMVSGHRYTQEEIIKIHTELYDPNLKC